MDHRKLGLAALTLGTLLGVTSITPVFAETFAGHRFHEVKYMRIYADGGYTNYGNTHRSVTGNCPAHLTNPHVSDGHGFYYDNSGTKTPCF